MGRSTMTPSWPSSTPCGDAQARQRSRMLVETTCLALGTSSHRSLLLFTDSRFRRQVGCNEVFFPVECPQTRTGWPRVGLRILGRAGGISPACRKLRLVLSMQGDASVAQLRRVESQCDSTRHQLGSMAIDLVHPHSHRQDKEANGLVSCGRDLKQRSTPHSQ